MHCVKTMGQFRHREETVNTVLGMLVSKMGVKAEAETILSHGHERPDVIFSLHGLRVVIEGKFADHPNAKSVVLGDASGRVARGIAHIAAGVVYPEFLRSISTSLLSKELSNTPLSYKIISETGESDWLDGTPDALMGALRRAQEALAQDDIVAKAASALAERLDGVAHQWSGQKGTCDRLAGILGMPAPKGESADQAEGRQETAARISALVIANALIFQEQLSLSNGRIQPLNKLENEADPVGAAKEHWRWIWENINYVPIFQLGERVLEQLPTTNNTIIAFRLLLREAKAICANQAALRHDLMGRIYHWLLHNAKHLGTYYTSVSAATLLLKLSMAQQWDKDFGDPAELAEFKVVDLACGTGTLLMAAAHALSDTYIRVRYDSGRTLNQTDLSTLHRALMENVLHGYDVLPTALHLTASTLAMLAPEVSFVRMNLYVMPLGMDKSEARLGSLDFLSGGHQFTQISLDYSQTETVRTGAGSSQVINAKVPPIDLCTMNPPFVRSVGGNLLFGSLPDDRGALQKELKKRVRNIAANITAGLGSVFVALADKRLKEGGRLAFVLPVALASGEAWAETRGLIAENYHLEIVIASHDAERQNFSENTDLSEIMFIARKRAPKEEPGDTVYINLWRNPRSIHEALGLADQIAASEPKSVEAKGFASISSSSRKLGEMVAMPSPQGKGKWFGALFAQTECLRAFLSLQKSELNFPGAEQTASIELCRLGALGGLGYDRRDIHDAFTVSTVDLTPYPAFWNHDAKKVLSIAQTPNANLVARTTAAKGRKLKDANQVWAKSGRILLVERLRTTTHRLLASKASY